LNTIKSVLLAVMASNGIVASPESVKIIRHTGIVRKNDPIYELGVSVDSLIEDGLLEDYQSTQGGKTDIILQAEYLISVVSSGKLNSFYGMYKVGGAVPLSEKYPQKSIPCGHSWITLDRVECLDVFKGVLHIDWSAPLQWLQNKDRPLVIVDNKVLKRYPGDGDLLISLEELKRVVSNSEYSDYRAKLSNVQGVYEIYSTEVGKTYIGSATGEEGVLGRWKNYAETGHGGNKYLKGLDYSKFLFSFRKTYPMGTLSEEVIHREYLEMEKSGTRVSGLN